MNLKKILAVILAVLILVLLVVAGQQYYRQIFHYQHNIQPIFTDKATVPLDTVGYTFIKEVGISSKVIAIGESTHGSREFNKIRFGTFKYLVNHCAYTTFLIEGDVGAFLPISTFVETGEGNLRELLADSGWWIWNTSEMYDIINWMRSYNLDPDHKVKLRFLGIDPRSKAKVLQYIISYYEKQHTVVSKEIISNAKKMIFAKRGSKEHRSLLDVLKTSMVKDLRNKRTITDSIWKIRFSMNILEQYYKLYSAPFWKQPQLRDALMADNVIAITKRGDKSLLAAHSMHIRKDKKEFAFGLLESRFCGYYLQQKLRKQYYALFIDFAFGTTKAIFESRMGTFPIHLKEGELSNSFYQSHRPSFFVNFRNVTVATMNVFNKKLLYQNLGSTYRTEDETAEILNVYTGFDGYLYLPQVSAAFRKKGKHKL